MCKSKSIKIIRYYHQLLNKISEGKRTKGGYNFTHAARVGVFLTITSNKEIRKYLQHPWGCNPHPPEADPDYTPSPPPLKKLFFKEKWLGGATHPILDFYSLALNTR
ncbi:MAG: hypothetical protein SNH99_07760, partial [Rikenellaceae bacterium]